MSFFSYKDRTASFPLGNHKKAFTNNGIFRPVIVIDGHVTGLWKRSFKKDKIIIDIDYLQAHTKLEKALIQKAAKSFGVFLNKNVEVNHGI
jgi:hypothetical protein